MSLSVTPTTKAPLPFPPNLNELHKMTKILGSGLSLLSNNFEICVSIDLKKRERKKIVLLMKQTA